jgi:acyl-CoA synthetase (AMP-forming)/AMP-acid ligase II
MSNHEPKVAGHFACELDAKVEGMPDFEVTTFENRRFPDEVLTYRDIVTAGRKIARELLRAGIGKGDRFAVQMRNHPEFLYAFYAASVTGAAAVVIDPRTKGSRLDYVLRDSKAKGILFTSELMEGVDEVIQGIPDLKVLGVAYKEGMDVPVTDKYPGLDEILAGPEVPPPDQPSEDLNLPFEVIYTSGTTGDPKGVVMKGSRMAAFSTIAQLVWQYTQEDKLYTGLSLTHGNAQAVTMMPSLLLAIPSVFSQRFTKSRIWDLCRKHGCTTFSLLGGMMMGIYSEPEKPDDGDNPVKVVLSAGTPLAIWESFEKRFNLRIHEWYGAVEGGFAHNPVGVGPVGSFGKALEGLMEMNVVRDDDTECAPHEVGELVSRMVGQEVEVEYLGKKKASEEKTRGGWLRSGDMCHTDEEGWLYFDYRKGGGLRRAGDFIMPEHVESVIATHPDVTDVCVYGIPAASGAPGEVDLVAAVVPAPGCTIEAKSVFQQFLEGLEKNSVPSYLQVVDAIPKTISEKNLDRVLREEFSKYAENVFKLEDFV